MFFKMKYNRSLLLLDEPYNRVNTSILPSLQECVDGIRWMAFIVLFFEILPLSGWPYNRVNTSILPSPQECVDGIRWMAFIVLFFEIPPSSGQYHGVNYSNFYVPSFGRTFSLIISVVLSSWRRKDLILKGNNVSNKITSMVTCSWI